MDFVGRQTPIGWLCLDLALKINAVVANPASDDVSIDAEVSTLYAYARYRCRRQVPCFDEDWQSLSDQLHGIAPDDHAARLQIRIEQYAFLADALQEAGVWDVTEVPLDDLTRP